MSFSLKPRLQDLCLDLGRTRVHLIDSPSVERRFPQRRISDHRPAWETIDYRTHSPEVL